MKIGFSYYIITMTIRNDGVSFPSAHPLHCALVCGVWRLDGNCDEEQPWSLQGEPLVLVIWSFFVGRSVGFLFCLFLFGLFFSGSLVFDAFFAELAVSSPSKIWADIAMLTILITHRNKWSTNLWEMGDSNVYFALSGCKYVYSIFRNIFLLFTDIFQITSFWLCETG